MSLRKSSDDQWMSSCEGEEPTIFELAERRDALEREATQLVSRGVTCGRIRDALDKCVGPVLPLPRR